MHKPSPRALGLALLAALFASGCAPTLKIISYEPSQVPVGPAKRIILTDGEGRRSAREFIISDFARVARDRGYFRVEDRSTQGLKISISGTTASVDPPIADAEPTDIFVQMDVLDWQAGMSQEVRDIKDKKGNVVDKETITVATGNVTLAVTVSTPDGRILLNQKDYNRAHSKSMASAVMSGNTEVVLQEASAMILDQVLADLTPRQVAASVRLDDSDESLKPYLETALKGSLEQAASDLKRHIDGGASSAAAWYNYAVFLDGLGRYEEALAAYDKAISLGGKDFYNESRAGCARRIGARDALS